MQYRTSLRLLVAVLVFASFVPARQRASKGADAGRLREHVTHLASEKLEGRRTGTPGAEAAARYVAEQFRKYGLEPGAGGGDGGRAYMQFFPYVARVELGEGNGMALSGRGGGAEAIPLVLRVGEDWMPLGFSANGRVEAAPAFVAYGITSGELNYDDYAGGAAKDRVAVALSGTPDGDNPHGRFLRAGDLRFKAAAARAAGAKALVVVSAEDSFKDERLARLSYDNSGGDAGLPVVVISRPAAAKLLGLEGVAGLKEFEQKVRESKAASKPEGQHTVVPDAARDTNVGLNVNLSRREAPAANVVGVLEGSDPKLKDEVIVVGAHYDHLGRGGRGSLAGREGEVHHGADDNASGTAALLELARSLSSDKSKPRRTVVFVAFGGEEEGLLGSKFYTEHPARPLQQTAAMLNLDMVGRLREDALSVGGVGTASEWRALVEKVNKAYDIWVNTPDAGPAPTPSEKRGEMPPIVVTGSNGQTAVIATPRRPFKLRLSEDGFGPSDHSSFYARRVPVLFFFTGTHEDYHKPSDTAERVNYEGLVRVTDFVRDIVAELQTAEQRPTFAQARAESNARATGFRVYLGTIPTYGDSTDGLTLDGVREDSPASKAGLRAGDRIVRLAGRDIRNVYDYTQALSEMKAGQEYEVEIFRAGERLTLKLTPAARR